MALACPQCAIDMREVKAAANTGYFILLDQCGQCGGVWCDRWELFPLVATDAHRIDAVDDEALRAASAGAAKQLECPRCRARLQRFRDPSLPPDARIERCPNCEGMWLNRGELRRVKPLRPRRATPITAATVDRLTTNLQTPPPTWPTVTNLDSAMQDPLPLADTADVGPELVRSGAWLAVRALLRLVLHV